MDYYQGVMVEYLRADRAMFVNSECCLQLYPSPNPDHGVPHWFCDAVAVDFRNSHIFLCEISYAAKPSALLKRLKQWHESWEKIRTALKRDCHLPEWPITPWVFILEDSVEYFLDRLLKVTGPMPAWGCVSITPLEMIAPWQYRSWDRDALKEK